MDESEIPIDIHTNKLLDWLISRRHVSRDWQTNIIKVREKINEAIKDMPVHEEIAKLLSGTYINYYHCQRIVQILKETESNTKNLFGQYGSKRMKDWLEVMKLYEKDNIYLGEAASLLLRNVNYEVPALRKQIARANYLRSDYVKKQAEYEKLANALLNEYNSTCKSLGIKGEKIKEELIKAVEEFPIMNSKVAKEAVQLKPAMEFYQKCVRALTKSEKEVLEILNFLIGVGDKTVYQWKYKKAPSSVEKISLSLIEPKTTSDDIDFEADIDYGADIDFGADESIDWGISTDDVNQNNENGNVENDSVAKGDEAKSILEYPVTRNAVLNDILELEAFLKLRLCEINNDSDSLMLLSLPEVLHTYDKKPIEGMLKNIQIIKDNLTNSVALHFLHIVSNPRYVDQLSEKLTQKWINYEKILASRDFVKNRQVEVSKEGDEIAPKVKILIEKSRELQELIEEDLSKRYKGRPVNLMGGVNTL